MKIEKKVTLVDTQDGKPAIELSVAKDGSGITVTQCGFRLRAPTIAADDLTEAVEAMRW